MRVKVKVNKTMKGSGFLFYLLMLIWAKIELKELLFMKVMIAKN